MSGLVPGASPGHTVNPAQMLRRHRAGRGSLGPRKLALHHVGDRPQPAPSLKTHTLPTTKAVSTC